MRRPVLLLVPVVAVAAFAAALALPFAPVAAREEAKVAQKVEDLAWLEGRWRSSDGKETFDEVWLPPDGGSMAAVSREVKDGRTAMFELSSIEKSDDGIVLRIRHFGAGLAPWKSEAGAAASPTWKLVGSAEREAVFEDAARGFPRRITYRRETSKDGDALVAKLEGERDGHPMTLEFRLPRVAAGK